MVLVYNCNNDVVAAAFIVGLQTDHSFYKHLVKDDVTNMKDILARELKEVMRARQANLSSRRVERKRRSNCPLLRRSSELGVGWLQEALPTELFAKPPCEVFGVDTDFTPFKIPIDSVFSAV